MNNATPIIAAESADERENCGGPPDSLPGPRSGQKELADAPEAEAARYGPVVRVETPVLLAERPVHRTAAALSKPTTEDRTTTRTDRRENVTGHGRDDKEVVQAASPGLRLVQPSQQEGCRIGVHSPGNHNWRIMAHHRATSNSPSCPERRFG
jgi:hypothetical protein